MLPLNSKLVIIEVSQQRRSIITSHVSSPLLSLKAFWNITAVSLLTLYLHVRISLSLSMYAIYFFFSHAVSYISLFLFPYLITIFPISLFIHPQFSCLNFSFWLISYCFFFSFCFIFHFVSSPCHLFSRDRIVNFASFLSCLLPSHCINALSPPYCAPYLLYPLPLMFPILPNNHFLSVSLFLYCFFLFLFFHFPFSL